MNKNYVLKVESTKILNSHGFDFLFSLPYVKKYNSAAIKVRHLPHLLVKLTAHCQLCYHFHC